MPYLDVDRGCGRRAPPRPPTTPTGTAAAAGTPSTPVHRVLRCGADNLTDRAWDRLLVGLDAGDPDGQVTAAWVAAQDLRLLYRASDRRRAETLLYLLLTHCAVAGVPELTRLARTPLQRFTSSGRRPAPRPPGYDPPYLEAAGRWER